MSADALIFTFLFTIFGQDPLEIGVGQLPDGRVVVMALTANPGGGTQLHSFIQQTPGANLQASNFNHTQIDSGDIFSISPQLVAVAGYLYMAAVCNFNACMYRLPVSTLNWEGPRLLTSSGDVTSASIALISGTLLALTLQTTANELRFLQADANVALLSALVFTTLYASIVNVANPFIGGHIAKTAFSDDGNQSCTIYRQMSGALVGNLVASCFVGAALVNTVVLQALSNAQGFVNSIEARALFYAGVFYFMYFLANGEVRLAALANPFVTAQLVTLGTVALSSGFPGMALVLGVLASQPYLFAYWPGNAVRIALATLTLQAMSGFPLQRTGPFAALVLLSAVFSVAIFGTGSLAATVMTESAAAGGAVGIPVAGGLWSVALISLLMTLALVWLHARRSRGARLKA